MLHYETLMLTSPDIAEETVLQLEKLLEEVVSASKGKIASFERWGKYKLSYPVQKHAYGIYILARYELPEDTTNKILEDIQTFFKIKANDMVMRHVSKKLENGLISYTKPESVEARSERKSSDSRPSRSEGAY